MTDRRDPSMHPLTNPDPQPEPRDFIWQGKLYTPVKVNGFSTGPGKVRIVIDLEIKR